MKKNGLIAAIVIILILLLGAGGYLMLNKNSSNSKSPSQTAKSNTQNTQTTKSLLDLIKLGQNLRCSFKSEISNGSTDGTFYISGQNVRGDFNVKTTDGKTMQTSMIKKGDTSYVWGAGLPGGIKMTVDLNTLSQNSKAAQYVGDPNQKVNYDCKPWSTDESLFTVPTNINFTDMTNLIMPKTTVTKTQTQSETTPSDPCAQITDPSIKAACESALQKSGK